MRQWILQSIGRRFASSSSSSNQQFAHVPGRIEQITLPCRHGIRKAVQFYRDCFSLESKSSTTEKGHVFGVRGGINIAIQPDLEEEQTQQQEEGEEEQVADSSSDKQGPSFPVILATTSNLKTTVWNAGRRRGIVCTS